MNAKRRIGTFNVAPTPIYAMGSVIQVARCPYNFRAAARVITTVDGIIIE